MFLATKMRILRRAPHVVDPVDIEAVQIHQLQLHPDHVRHSRGRGRIRALGGKLVGNQIGLSGQALEEARQDLFRGAHAVGVGGVPQVQAAGHRRVEDGSQRLGGEVVSKGSIIAPGPRAEGDFRQLAHGSFLLISSGFRSS